MIEEDYPADDQITHIDWHTSGAWANGSGATRGDYYGVSAAPDVWFDGTQHVLGAGDSVSAYNEYRPIVDAHFPVLSKLIVASQLDLNADTMTGTITVDVEVAPGETISPSTCVIRAALYEDDCFRPFVTEPHTGRTLWDYIGRMMITEQPLTISNAGETQQVVATFPIDAVYNIANLHAVAFVQRDSNRNVIQSSQAQVQYDCTLADLDPPVAKTNGTQDFDWTLTYTGASSDDVVLTIDETALPAGWDAVIVWNATSYPSTLTIPNMTANQVENVTVHVIPSGPGLGTVVLTAAPFHNQSSATAEVRTVHTFSQTPSLLFVDDDQGAAYETIFQDAIAGAGYFALTQEVVTQGNPDASWMQYFDAVIWTTGELPTATIGPANQPPIEEYLDGGGRFFLSSQGYLNHQGVVPAFSTTYLHVSAFTLDVGAPSVTGVGGDPIGDGLSFPLTPPFVDKADHIVPNTGAVIWLESGANDVGVRYDSGVFRTVFMSASFEGVSPPNDALLMGRVLDWLVPGTVVDAPIVGVPDRGALALYPNAPNPFGASTTVRFALPQAGPVGMAVYDVTGRKVRDLVSRRLEAGTHAVEWDGRDGAGSRVASGVYLVRLNAAGRTVSREMVRVK